jgi:hypothetical protein
MEQKPPRSAPLRIAQEPSSVRYYIGPRGIIFYILAVLVLFFGVIGYVEYERLVVPYMRYYICCLPAGIIAGILLFFGFASRVTTLRRVHVPANVQREQSQNSDAKSSQNQTNVTGDNTMDGTRDSDRVSGLRKYEPVEITKDDLVAKKRNLQQFLKNLDEQHQDRLITSNVYLSLKAKYHHELSGVNGQLKSKTKKPIKKIKKSNDNDN